MTASNGNGHAITTMAQLEALYCEGVYPPAKFKEVDRITPAYRKLVEASPFFALATIGPDGLDCSPRGDPAGFVRVVDDRTVIVPDRRGNNRIDTLRNLVRDPRISLLFMIPGIGSTLRINGRAEISADPELCASFAERGKAPRTVLVVTAERVYFQCPKALVRSRLWSADAQIAASELPSTGEILAALTKGKIDGTAYDAAYLELAMRTGLPLATRDADLRKAARRVGVAAA